MKVITIPEKAVIGLAGKGDTLRLTLFLEDPIEFIVPLEIAKSVTAMLSEALLRKAQKDAA